MKKLRVREQRFLTEYLLHYNPQKAALAAGYSRTVAQSHAYQWVSASEKNPKPHVYETIKIKENELIQKTEISIEKIEDELALMGFGKTKGELTPGDKLKALELLGKRRGMFKENIEVTGNVAAAQILIHIPDNGRSDNDEDNN